MGLVTLGTLPVIRPVIDVYSGDATKIGASLRHAVDLTLVWATVLAVVGWLFAAFDERLRIAPRVTRAAGVAVSSFTVLLAIGALAFAKPWPHANSAWHSFKYAGEPQGTASHFGGLGSNRYDFWRVALLEFKRHPVQGIGPNNFLVPYLEERRSSEEPIYPHSILLGLLSQTGLIGTALFIGFLTSALVVVRHIPEGPRT